MKKNMLKTLSAIMLGAMVLTACGTTGGVSGTTGGVSGDITVVSREDGSGTRGAFIELLGIEEKDADGNKVDMTTDMAKITNSTSVMMTTVQGDVNAIGYCSLGSLNDTVTALKVDGVDATAENILAGTYKVVRPFNIVTNGNENEIAKDFISFIFSPEGQSVVEENGYISVGAGEGYTVTDLSGKIVVAGSSSVTPVMEKLKEAYEALQPNVTVEVQQSDSSTGVQSVIDGLCDIGMASRDLKDGEISNGVEGTAIAQDGIAVIVNNDSNITELTSAQIKSIYTGEVTTWEELK